MRTHTILTKAASVAVCFGILLSGPASAFGGSKSSSMTRDIELTADGTLYGQVYTPEGKAIESAVVELRYQGNAVAKTATAADGQFVITGVRGGSHDLAVGSMTTPVRLWKNGTAPAGAVSGAVLAASEHVVRGQYGEYCPPAPTTSGFGLIDIVTVGLLATSVTGLVYAIDTNNELDDIKSRLPASP